MARFTRKARAEEDLIEIWSYIAEDNPQAADQSLDKIDEACARLANIRIWDGLVPTWRMSCVIPS